MINNVFSDSLEKQISKYRHLFLQKKIKSFLVLLIVISVLNTSCSQVKEEISPITQITTLKKDTVYKIQDRDFVDMMIIDSLLVLIANKDPTFFHVFHKTTLNPIINFAKKGSAEFEFNYRPLFLKQYYENNNYFEVFDLYSIKKVNLKNILVGDNVAGEIRSERLNEDLILSREIVRLDSNFLTGTSLNRTEGLFYIYNKKNRNKKWINFDPKLKINKKYFDSLYYGLIEVSPDSKTIVYCPRFFNRILYFNRDGKFIKALNFSKIKTPKIEKKYLGVSNAETIYSYQTYRTSNFLYVLRPIQSLDDLISNISPIKVQVLCLTWDGNISKVYELNLKTMPTLFCIDEKDKKILFHTPLDSSLSNDIISEISIYSFE